MRGHIAKRGNRYYAVVYQGTDPGTGKDKYKWVAAGTRRSDAERLVNELVGRVNSGEDIAPDRTSLATYLTDRWLPHQELRLRPTTYLSYCKTVELHVVPHIGRLRLDKLQADDLEALYVRLLKTGRRNGKGGGLSPTSVRYVHRVLHKALGDAHRKGLVSRNVATMADPPKVQANGPKSRIQVWDAPTLRRFLDVAANHRLACLWLVAANTGMRRGELLGLRWADVDLEAATISVRHAVVSAGYQLHLSDVKTASGRRVINIDDRTVGALARRRRDALGAGDSEEISRSLMFGDAAGEPVHPELITRSFDRLVARHSLPRIRFHDIRHTHATLLLKAGVPAKVVSERLGHATPGFTLNVYQHVLPGMQAEAAEVFRRLTAEDGDTEEPDPLDSDERDDVTDQGGDEEPQPE